MKLSERDPSWRAVPGFIRLWASPEGEVFSNRRGTYYKKLSPQFHDRHRRWFYRISIAGKLFFEYRGSLVCAAFRGERPAHLLVRHKNDDREDDRAENLCWGTPSENSHDAVRNGSWVPPPWCRGEAFEYQDDENVAVEGVPF